MEKLFSFQSKVAARIWLKACVWPAKGTSTQRMFVFTRCKVCAGPSQVTRCKAKGDPDLFYLRRRYNIHNVGSSSASLLFS